MEATNRSKRKRFYRVKEYKYGLVTVLEGKNNRWIVYHTGNMGTTLSETERCVDHLFGPGFFQKLYKNKVYEDGFPSYEYTLESEKVKIC